MRKKLAAVEEELAARARPNATARARELPAALLADYERILQGPRRPRGGRGEPGRDLRRLPRDHPAPGHPGAAGAERPLMRCESCGRYLYWQECRLHRLPS